MASGSVKSALVSREEEDLQRPCSIEEEVCGIIALAFLCFNFVRIWRVKVCWGEFRFQVLGFGFWF